MKKSIVITAILIALSSKTYSQEKSFSAPDYELIKKNIQDKNSNYYYPKLMARMIANDTLLSREDYRYLYFGYVFDSKYNAYFKSPDEEKLSKYLSAEKIEEKDYDEIIKIAEHSISEFPFDLRQMNYLGYIYQLKGDEAAVKKMANRFQGIFEAILSSGNGEKCETGLHVISVSHEYVFLNMFRLESESQSLVGNCDYLAFEKGKYKVDGIYFNIQKMLENGTERLK